MAFGGLAEVLELVQAKRPMLAIDEDEIEVELPQNVDHPWGCEREVVAVRFASGTHGGFDSVGLLHPMSSYVRRLRSDRPNPVGVWPVGSGRTPYQEKPVSKMSCKAPSGQRPLCTESAHTRDWFAGSKWTRADIPQAVCVKFSKLVMARVRG